MTLDELVLQALASHQTSRAFDPDLGWIPRDCLGPAGRAAHYELVVTRLAKAGLVENRKPPPGEQTDPAGVRVRRVTDRGLAAARAGWAPAVEAARSATRADSAASAA